MKSTPESCFGKKLSCFGYSRNIIWLVVTGVLAFSPLVHSQTNCVPVLTGLVSWWKAEGNANDVAGLNNGTLLNGTSFAAGEVGQAFRFDGQSNYVSIPSSASLNIGLSNGLTIECWVKPNELTIARPLVEWNDGVN